MSIAVEERKQIESIVDDLWDDRVSFFKEVLGVALTDYQGDVLKTLDRETHVVVGSGHACGKSMIMAGALLHYMSCRPYPKILCTAPSKHQLYQVLWAELSKWHRKMLSIFGNQFMWTKEKFFHRKHPEEWFAAARTATKEKPEALQGFHTDYVMRCIDEGSGVPEEVFDVLLGATGIIETKELMTSNPTRLDGQFYRAFHEDKKFYKTHTWNTEVSPYADPQYVPRMQSKYGIDSNIYRVRVLGLFPHRDSDSFIPYDLAHSAVYRDILPQDGMRKVFGVDVARYGEDETVIAIRHGDEFKPFHRLRQKSTMEVAGYVAHLANKELPQHIFVDVIGIGSGVFDRLEELGYPVYAVNVAELPALNGAVYKRLRDELWGSMRDWLESRRGKMYDSPEGDLVGQLTTPTYKFTSSGQIVLETKDEMKKRGVDSPNVADAHVMTFAMPTSEYTLPQRSNWWNYEEEDEFNPLDPEAGY